MAKSSPAGSTRSKSALESELGPEELANLLRQPALAAQLPGEQVTELLLRGALFTLERDGAAEAVEILAQTAQFCPVIALRGQAVLTLGRLAQNGSQAAGDALYALAIHAGSQAASQFVQQHAIPVSRPDLQAVFALLAGHSGDYRRLDPDLRLLTAFFLSEAIPDLQDRLIAAANAAGLKTWAVIAAVGRAPGEEALRALQAQFGALPESERALALEVLASLAAGGSVPAREAICQLYIDYEFIPARALAITHGYVPAAPVQAALFYFLAEQWQIYEYLDFNQGLLASAYEAAGENLRKRILYLSRYSGHTEWMNGLSTSSRQRWLWDLNDADWDLAIRNLSAAGDYANLWRLAQMASPVWSAQIVSLLSTTAWQPPSADEQDGYRRFQELVLALEKAPPPVIHLQSWPSPSPDIACLALSPDGAYLAAGGSNATIHLWGIYKSPSPLPPIIGAAPPTRALAFCPDGEYLAAASGDNSLRAFRLSDGKLVKSLEGHTGLVRALAFAPDGRSLFSASFDGSLRAWRFPQGPELKPIEAGKAELFGLAASPDGQILLAGGTDQKLRVYRWPDGDLLWQLDGHTNTITALVTVPRGQLAASAGRDGLIILWNYIAGRAITRIPSEKLITALAFHPNEQFILGASAQGGITFWNISTGKKIESLAAHSAAIAGLAVSADGQQLFSASTDGTLSAWDLQIFTWARTPIGSNRSQALTQVEQRARQAGQKPAERNWLAFIAELIRWRQRFDVELEETHQIISVGEFDIEL